jgi:hypothetical protein
MMHKPIKYCKPGSILLVLKIYKVNIKKSAAANFKPPVCSGMAVQLQKKVSHRIQA